MPSISDLTCKRCSVTRVNALVRAYHAAHAPDGKHQMDQLLELCSICQERGFKSALELLDAGLSEKNLRALCWNVSSFLKDNEVEAIMGIKIKPPL